MTEGVRALITDWRRDARALMYAAKRSNDPATKRMHRDMALTLRKCARELAKALKDAT